MLKAVFIDAGCTFVKSFKNRDKELNELLAPFDWNWQRFYPYWRKFIYCVLGAK